MIDGLKNKLKNAVNFPSPPAIAQQIIELASDPDIDVNKVATAIAKDPGLTAKVLRVANSPLFSKQRKSDNLRQALIVLGLNAATTLALSFSLVGAYKGVKSNGIDYTRYWRRTILCASAARAFGAFKQLKAVEDLFLAALLQDIAIIAIDRVQPDFYTPLPPNAVHAELLGHEVAQLGMDHAALGAWLLQQWNFSESLCRTVAWSHSPPNSNGELAETTVARCVALGSECVEILLAPTMPTELSALSERAMNWLGMGPEELTATMAKIIAEIPEIERLFDTRLLDADASAAIVEQAQELLLMRNLQTIEHVSTLQQSSERLQVQATALEQKNQRDSLTGIFNRGHLDRVLEQEFQSATQGGWPLSLVFVDLDHFKRVNDTYGHPAGDTVLIETAKLILLMVRHSDCVARYGGEEFVIILPGLAALGAQALCERLLQCLRDTRHELVAGPVTVTASLGLATHSSSAPFRSAEQLLAAADRSVYSAKKAGRDRLVCHEVRTVVALS